MDFLAYCHLLLQCLLKPTVKERTRPIDLKLHSDIRAIDRAEFDQQVPLSFTFFPLTFFLLPSIFFRFVHYKV